VLRGIFGTYREEEAGGWRRLYNEELYDLYASPNITRVIKSKRRRWAKHVARMGRMKNSYKIFIGKPEGKRPLGRPRHRCEDNRMDLRKMEWEGGDASGSG